MAVSSWVSRRNRLLSNPRFQAWAARFPVTRRIARARAGELFDLVAGFTYSQALFAFVELGLLDRLTEPMSVEMIASACDLPLASAQRLIDAAVALNLAERVEGSRVMLGQAGAALAGNPGAIAMIAHHSHLYADLGDPVALLRRQGGNGAVARFWDYDPTGNSEAIAHYSALMAQSQSPVAAQILDAYSLTRHRRVLDVGGGEGAFLAAVALRHPALELGLFDLPAVGARAASRLGEKATLHGGDFLTDPLPSGYDLVTLIRVLHDHDDLDALRLLRAVRAALPAGGRLLIGEPMSASPDSARMAAAYFGLYFLAMGRGRARRPEAIGKLLKAAGFTRWEIVSTAMPLIASAIIAIA